MSEKKIPAAYRIVRPIAEILEEIAEEKKQSSSMVLEMLILKEAINMDILVKGSPDFALYELFNRIDNFNLPAEEKYTFNTFEEIKNTDALSLYTLAVTPVEGERADKRKQFVNQRIGRFCKKKIGWESDEEVTLPKGSNSLIKGYTKLRDPN